MKHSGSNKTTGIYLFLALLLVGFLLFFFLERYPKSKAFYVTGAVVSKATSQGYGSSGDILRVKLQSGIVVTVGYPLQTGLRVGDRVKLSGYERYIISPMYQFVSKL